MTTNSRQPESEEQREDISQEQDAPRHRINVPGFVTTNEIGLGDVVKKVTTSFGIRPCRGCERRAAALNRWMSFRGR